MFCELIKNIDLVEILAIVLSIIALIIATTTQRMANITNIKPIIISLPSEYTNHKKVELYNAGHGTAHIHKIIMRKDKKEKNCLADLFKLGDSRFEWDDYFTFEQDSYYLLPDKKIILAEITEGKLIESGYDKIGAKEILNKWEKQLAGIYLEVQYNDLFNSKMQVYKHTFK